ncbi:hypothetical protein [Botryobacter ruber]|uniref:hypothetical protein n=1 Tax=Botryobacter ruber TaxID=2171629 RepID=UPI000E0ACA8D|nr:hypothetical protein [Botryobacter ruber]
MRNILTERVAANGFLGITALVVLFHLLVIFSIIPPDMVWGGRIGSATEMMTLEVFSIALNLVMFAVVAVKAGVIRVKVHPTVVKVALWTMAVLFLLNTVGNLLSNNELEKLLFTPLTLLLSVFCFRLALPAAPQKA